MKQEDTKQKILDKALELFSARLERRERRVQADFMKMPSEHVQAKRVQR